MTPHPHPRHTARPLRPLTWLLATFGALLLGLLPACGGVGSEGTGSFASGPITGFGSIIVNGVHFDESGASVVDDDGVATDSGQLALGAVVQVTAGPITTTTDGTQVATATRVQVTRSVVGPVSAVDEASGQLTVLGQSVRCTSSTVLDTRLSGGLNTVPLGQVLEVFGAYSAESGAFVATRIGLADSSSPWRVRGPVSTVDPGSKTFRIGAQTYSYTAASELLRDGAVVQVQVQAGADGRWQLKGTPKADDKPVGGETVELRGLVASFSTPTRFVLDGVTVDVSGAQLLGSLSLGGTVQVSGRWQGSAVVADKVVVEDGSVGGIELRGKVSALDTVAKRLTLRGTQVYYGRADLQVDKGSLVQLALGRTLRVEGVLSADRTVVEALRLSVED